MTISRLPLFLAAASTVLLGACSTMPGNSTHSNYSQASLPAAVQVPAGHQVAMETVATGELTYECRDKAGMPGTVEWVFVGPKATLADRAGKRVGTYYGPPATWESSDGSKVSGSQVAVAPSGAGNIPYQLVKANPTMGSGAMTGYSYIQRVALKGGAAPATGCTADTNGTRTVVPYQGDYIFWKAV